MEVLKEEIKELRKEINILNQILLSSHIGENLRTTPLNKAQPISRHYKEFITKLKQEL